MSEKLDPITNLPEEPAKKTVNLDDVLKKSVSTAAQTLSPSFTSLNINELIKPVDVSKLINEPAPENFKQIIKGGEIKRDTDFEELYKTAEERQEQYKNDYLQQLDDEQGSLQVVANSIGKFGAKVVTGTAAGLLGFAWGLFKAVGTGSLNPIMENEVYDAYDYVNEGINNAMPIYTSNANYHNQGFFDKLFSADAGKLLGDEVGDALAFTASAILQEVVYTAITAGTFGAAAPLQAAGTAGIALRGAKLLNKGMKVLKAEKTAGKIGSLVNNLEEASKIASTANTLNKFAGTARGLVMSSSFEAGIEARGTKESYIQEATARYEKAYGYSPGQEALQQIEQEAESAMWSNYLGNLAILSTSHLAQFSSIFLKGARVAKETSDATRHITKAADGSLDVAKKSKLGKAATYTYLTVKNPITEGLEESAQGISNAAALDYWGKAYDPEYNWQNLSYLQSTINGGKKYVGTNEAGNSFGIGFLVGMLGMPMPKKMGGYSGGVYGEIKGYNQSLERAKKIAADLNANPSLAGSMAKNYQNMVKANGFSADMDRYAETGDVYNFKNAEHDYLFSYIKNRVDLGMGEFLNEDFEALEKMSLEDFNNEFKIEGVSEFTQKEKSEKIRKAKAFAEDVTKYTEAVQNILDYKGTSKEVGARVSDTIVHAASTLKNMDVRESELTKQLEEMVGVSGVDIANITIATNKNSAVRKLTEIAKKQLTNEELTKQEKKDLKNILGTNPRAREIYNTIKSTKDSKTISELTEELGGLVTVDSRGTFTNKADQTDFINQAKALIENASKLKAEGLINKENAEKLVEDIAKIKERREIFSQYYEFLVTEKGIKALNEATLKAEQLRAKDIQEDIDQKAEEVAKKATTEADDSYVSTVSADASDEVKEKIAKAKDDKAKQGLKKVGDIDKSNIRDHVQARWNMSNPELKELYLKEKPLFLEQFAGKFGLPTLPNMKNATPNAIKSYIAQALDGAEGNELADALIAFFEGNKAALDETIESDVKKALDENEEVQTTEPTEPKYANYQPVKAPADANRTQGSEFAMEFNGEFWEYSRDENNQLIDNEDFNSIIDSEYANTQVKESDTVTIELSLEHTFGTDYGKANKTNPDKLALVVVHTDSDGVKHPISTVAAYQERLITQANRAQYEALKAMRADVFNQLIKDGYIDAQFNITEKGKALGNSLIATSYSSVVELVLPGRRIFSEVAEDYKPVTEVLGKDVTLGVAISTEGRTEIQFPNSNKETLVLPNVQAGAVYALVEENGTSFPVRLNTRKINDEESNTVKVLLDDAKKLDLSTDAGKASLADIKSQINDIVYVSEAELTKALSSDNQLAILKNNIDSRRAQVSRFKINTKGYNEALGDKVVTSISDRATSRNFVLKGYSVNNKSNVAEDTSGVIVSEQSQADRLLGKESLTGTVTSTESQTQTATQPNISNQSEIEAKKADIERRRQESLNAIKRRPNETLFTAPYYKEGYNFKQLPTISTMRTEAEEKEYYEILTKNNTLTDVSIQVKTREEAEKLINAKYDAELKALESTEVKPEATPKSRIPVSALGESMGSNIVEESTPTVVKRTRINLNEDSDAITKPTVTPKRGSLLKDDKFKLKEGKTGKINTKKALEWLKTALPNVPVTVLGEYVKILNEHGAEAWGVFRNGGIEFLENAPQGVPYHEAFHAIFNSYLSESDQVLMMIEAQAKTGLTDDLALEEWLADRFADFMITKFEDKSLGKKILEFFRGLLKSLNLVSDSKLNEYFTELSQTIFKGDKKVISESRFKNKDPFTAAQRYNRIAMLTDMFMQVLNAQKESTENKNKSINSIINNYTFTTKIITTPIYGEGTAILSEPITFKGVSAIFADVYAGQLSDMYNEALDVAEKDSTETFRKQRATLAAEQAALVMDNFFVKRGDAYELSDLLVDAASALKENYINVRINSVKSDPISVEETNEELADDAQIDDVESLDNWMVSSAKLNTKDTASWILKFKVSNIDKNDGFDDIGYPIKYSAENLMASMKHDMVDLLDVGEMIEYMNTYKNIKPYYKTVLELMSSDAQFKAAFFNTFSTVKVGERLMIKSIETEDGELVTKWMTIDNSGVNNTDLLLEEWDSAFKARLRATSELGKEDGRRKSPLEKMTKAKADLDAYLKSIINTMTSLEPMVNAKGLKLTEARKISGYLNEFGIGVTAENIKSIFDNNYLVAVNSGATVSNAVKTNPLVVNLNGSMGTMLAQLLEYAKTYNPEVEKRSPLVSEKKLTETFVKSVANTVDTIYESSALNADGEKVMVNRVPNFLHRQLLKLRKNKNGIIEKYKRDPFYTKNLWLSELETGTQGLFKYMEVGGIKEGDEGNTYFNLSPRDKIITSLLNYYGNTNESTEAKNAWYETPILADMNKLPLISMKKYDINEVVKHLEDVYNTETDRIERVKSDQARYNAGENIDLIEFYHYVGTKDEAGFAKARGLKRHYLPITKGESLSESIKEYLDNEVANYNKKIKSLGVETAAGSSKYTNGDFVRRFVYNKFLADINMNQLFNGDSAYYKSDTDMSKRTSQLGKPAQLLSVSNIPATYNTMYFENLIVDVSGAYSDIIEATEGTQKNNLLKTLSGVDRADAQGVISIERWKDIMSGQGLFKDEYLEAYNNIKDNKATAKDLVLIMQPIKPFYYGLESVGNKVVPTQNKNSEYVLLPSMRGSNPSVDKMLDLFDSGIQSVQFHSAVKVGAMRVQNLDTLTDISPESIAGKFVTLSNSTYGIQLNVPEHHMDAEILFGTQIRKLIISNLKDTTKYGKYTINGVEYSKDELLRLYMDTINSNLIEDSVELDKFFADNSKLVDLLSAEVRDRGLAKKYLKTLALDSEGEFMFPLFFPITSKKAESLMSSLFANRITKQKIKGGSFVQVSDVLSSKNLRVIRDEETGAIIEMEAMMPWTSKKFMPLNDAGEVDFDYISENHSELLEAVGFRIPTEDKYSMPVIKIVGFLPQQSGGTIMLPADFIALSGSDFDVDKLFVMLKEFKSTNSYLRKEYELKDYQINQLRNGELYIKGASEFIKGKGSHYTVESGSATKESRNNLLIDITRGILQDPYHAKEIINPGSFVRYKNLRDKIADLSKNKQSDNFNINLPTNQLELFMRNTAGKELIGIFANHNVNHSLVQHLEISVRALDAANNVKVFKFINGDTAYNLDGSIATQTDGEYTSRFLAELLAAAVDNAKDPVLSSLNINTYTADFVSYLLRTGLSPELTMLFINQPVIKSISDKYFNSNEDRRELVKIIRDTKEDYPVKPEYSNIPLSKKDLEANIESMNKDTQSRVLSYFLDMMPASEELGTITQSMRADAKPSKTMTANSQFLKKYDRLDESIRSESSPVNMVHYFTELGIRKANETLSKYFPWQNDKFTAIKNKLTSIKEYELTEQEEDFVNAQVISYLTKDYELFDISEEERLNLFNDLPAKFNELKSGELANNMFMQVTSLVDAGTKKSGKYKIIGVDNAQSISETQKEAIERAFLELYESHPEFAKELLKYSYITSGTSFTRHSYLQLLPIEIFTSIKDENGRTYQEHLKNAVESNFNTEDFVDVFIKNFSHKYSFVKEFRDKDIVESKRDNNNNYIYLLVNKDESNIFAAPKFKKDKLGRIYKLYLETDTQSLYLPVPKLGIENVLYEPNNTSSISIKNDIVLTFKEKADVYESEGVNYATQLIDGKYKISKLNAQYRMIEDMGTFNNVTDLLIKPTLGQSNKDVFINDIIFKEDLNDYYNKYVADAARFEIVDNDVIEDVVNEEELNLPTQEEINNLPDCI